MGKDILQNMREKWSDQDHLLMTMNFKTDSFFLRCYDTGGFGTCESVFNSTLSFPSSTDFLGYLRFSELPRILSYWAGNAENTTS